MRRIGQRRWMLLLVAVLMVTMSLSACGRKGPPTHPEGSDYPKTFPQE